MLSETAISSLNGIPVRELPAGEMMADAALYLLSLQPSFEMGGRGPLAFDGFGFVRQVVQMTFDARAFMAKRRTRALLDMPLKAYPTKIPPQGLTPADAVTVEPDATDLQAVLIDAGMEIVEGRGAARTQAGDVALYLGHGPCGAIILRGIDHPDGEAVAMAWNEGPRVRNDVTLGRHRVRVFRWPELAVVS
jgi:hypothetical protein